MIPCLYESTETAYTTNGIGKLSDCISCVVAEKRNSSYELFLEYPADGIHATSLLDRNIILAKPAEGKSSQAFRIYLVTTNLSGTLEIYARHISYELNFITASSVSGNSAITALQSLKYAATTNCNFEFVTDIDSAADMSIEEPNSLRNILGGIDGSILDTYGGEFEWDMYNVILHKERGSDNGVRIVYGKNLADFTMDKNSGDTITGVHPYWIGTVSSETTASDEDEEESTTYTEEEVRVELPEKIIMAEGATDYRIKVLDCSSAFETQPTVAQLRSYAKAYLESTESVEPDIDITIDFVQLWQLPEYKNIAAAECVQLCDTVYVYISKLGIELSMKVTETEYDSLLERYKSITLSNALSTSSHSLLSTLTDYTTALVNKKLSYYTTTAELETKLEVSQGQILLQISEVYATYAQLEETYEKIDEETNTKLTSYYTIDETEAYITMAVDEISSVVSDTTTRVETLEEVVEDPETGLAAVYTYMTSETEKLWTEIEQLPDSVQIAINATYQSLVETDESIQTQLNEYATYFSFTSSGLKISESDSAFALLLGPSKISFLESDSEVAYISDSMLYIYDAYILNTLRIGAFQWQPDSGERLNLVKVG